ncbi:prepilin-type N-terminal cleavage/methylation domain-containing protein [Clostridium sp. CF012]|uniref:prepilin-type N-terminal cleavage/methylation domain-containing protein n=1 Tax=Clostridium sp. CF012 TaxID=2843319 RepID=UPI001C0B8B04|nr:prepilin-type N-terminal cleavage/methylation domain-containing protein [Clostridium sp. CF012]MBU3144903.1 prepilin-type N-terminal cleavage/methylation domain-containing protein [Clostridium sp. CF012]
MIRKDLRYNKGFTLVELILTIAITSLVIMISANLLILGTKSHKLTVKEYDLQSSIRIVTEETTKIVRYSKAVFAVPQTFISSTNSMDPGWNYFMVSPDRKRIVVMEYNGSKHKERVLVGVQDNIEYEVFFEKDASAKSNNAMKYKIYAYAIDAEGNRTREKIVFESTVESTNAVQVVDKGTKASPSVALAYRNDGQTSGKGKNQIAYITIVTDVSGSMNETPAGAGNSSTEATNARIRYVREALTGTLANPEAGIIQRFSKEENVFISLVPFSTTGNYPNPTANKNPSDRQPIYDVYLENKKNDLVEVIKKTKAAGGTNTGDGLRQAYNLHNDFRTRMSINVEDQVHHYMILLVDGETTYETKKGNWNRYENGSYWNPYRWEFNASTLDPKYYLDKGNIDFLYEDDQKGSNPNTNYAITGNGSDVITKSPSYVTSVGSLIKNFDAGNGVKSYLIGYASNLGTHIRSIGTSIGTEPGSIYRYDDPGFNLDEVFKNIANDIMSDFWLVSGPQIIK